jgi:energy-coupling factor transporter ATP-binding protein EcfA2
MLRIENLSKAYGNGVQALKNVSLEIPRGMLGLLGPNGAGKSTLMRTIAMLQRYLSRVAFAGPPYTTTAELLEEIRPTVPEGSAHLVEDLLERITMFDNKVATATSTKRADGTFLLRIELEAHKRQGDGPGAEHEIPIDDWMDIAVFGEEQDSKVATPYSSSSGDVSVPRQSPSRSSSADGPHAWRSTRTTSSSIETAVTTSAPCCQRASKPAIERGARARAIVSTNVVALGPG